MSLLVVDTLRPHPVATEVKVYKLSVEDGRHTGVNKLMVWVKNETAKLRRSTRWRVYDFWGSILNLFPILGIHFIRVRIEWTSFLGIHSVSNGRHRVDRLFGDPPGSPISGSLH